MSDRPASPVVYGGPATPWRGSPTPLEVDSPADGWDSHGRESVLRWACRATFPDAQPDAWGLVDQLALDHEGDPAGLAEALSALADRLALADLGGLDAGYRWTPEGLRHDAPPATLATWRWFATRLLDELARRRRQAAAEAATADRRQRARAAYEASRHAEPTSGSALTRAERQFVIDYFLLADGHVAERVASTPTERAVREVLGQGGYHGDGWVWDTMANSRLGVLVSRTPDGHSGIITWREVLDAALGIARPTPRQEALF
jgi:hypothetical protein